MPRRSLDNLIHFVHRLARREDGALTDAELLSRFAERRDEAAFEALVWRHGHLIWNVCRRILPNQQDAEDAFQAAFLVLARKADAVRKRNAVGGWLYQVARRIALGIREKNQGLPAHPLPESVAAESNDSTERSDLRQFLEEELGRLPLKYRMPAVLHYLEGRSIAETAAIVGCPRGTILSRLAWSRLRLRTRLTVRGIGLGAALAVVPATESSAAPMPIVLDAVSGAVAFVSKQAMRTSRPVSLAKGVLRAMLMTKVAVGSIGIVSVLTASVGLAMVAMPGTELAPIIHAEQSAGVDQHQQAKDQNKVVDQSKPQKATLPQANYVLPLQRSVVDNFLFTGRTEASRTVAIHPEISGTLDKLVVKPGSRVKKGDLLFVVDSKELRGHLDTCIATVRRHEAELTQAKIKLQAASAQEEGFAKAKVEEAESFIQAGRAALNRARLEMEQTRIVAPIDGRVGRMLIDSGNVVNPSSVLTTIVSVSPISVSFSIDENSFRRLQKQLQSPDVEKEFKVEMGLGADTDFPHEGTLDTDFPHEGTLESIDNRFDPATATILARASFPNFKEEILPGMFARIRLSQKRGKDEMLVPQNAVRGIGIRKRGSSHDETYVYVISADNKLAAKDVVLGSRFDQYRIVRSGLKADDRVVVSTTPGDNRIEFYLDQEVSPHQDIAPKLGKQMGR